MAFHELPEGLLRCGVPVEAQRFPRGLNLSEQLVSAAERLNVAVAGAALRAGLAVLGAVTLIGLDLCHTAKCNTTSRVSATFPGGDTVAVLATGVTGEDNERVAYIMPESELRAVCDHGYPIAHPCGYCRLNTPAGPRMTSLSPAGKQQTGWLCGGCGHSFAPWVPECHHCPVPADIDGCP